MIGNKNQTIGMIQIENNYRIYVDGYVKEKVIRPDGALIADFKKI